MNKFYSYGKQTIEDDDIDAVVEVLKGDWLTQGPSVKNFEEDISKKFNAKFVTAVSNGTAGLHLLGIALGWTNNDVIITSPLTFLASANCIVYSGARPDFADITRDSYTIDADKLEKKVLNYRSKGIKIHTVIGVDYAGHPCDWKKLKELAHKYDFKLINDNCHAMGAEYYNETEYACKYADAVVMSFHPVKNITTGEGGAVLTNNHNLFDEINLLRSHGMTKDDSVLCKNDGPWYYEMHKLGFNYRITDIQSALGSSQIKKLGKFLNKRNSIAEFYNEQFENDSRFSIPKVLSDIKHAYHLYPLQINFSELQISKKDFFIKMRENNIGLQVHYIPVHLQPYYKNNFGFSDGDYPNCEEFYEKEVSIPIYPLLEKDDLVYISKKIKELAI